MAILILRILDPTFSRLGLTQNNIDVIIRDVAISKNFILNKVSLLRAAIKH